MRSRLFTACRGVGPKLASSGFRGIATAGLAAAFAGCGGGTPGITVKTVTIAPYTGPALGQLAEADGPVAPALAGTDPITSQPVSLADYDGKPVVINFWASWCGGCNEEAPALRELAVKHPEAVVLGIDTDDAEADAKRFYEKWMLQHPSIADPDGKLAARYAVPGLPTTFFLSASHRTVAKILGAASLEAFEQGLAKAESSA